MKNQQLWRCEICNYEYEPALPATEVLCPNNHLAKRGRGGRGLMTLISGSLPVLRKKATSGNQQH